MPYRRRIATLVVLVACALASPATALAADTTRPTGMISAIPVGPFSGTVTLTGTSADTESAIDHVDVTYTGPGTGAVCLSPASPAAWSCQWNTTALVDGSYTIELDVWDAAGNQIAAPVTRVVTVDNTPPTGGSITSTTGAGSVAVTFANGVDAGTGIASSKLKRQIASHDGVACGAFDPNLAQVAPTDSASPFVDTAVATGNCYRYTLVVTDNAGNEALYPDATIHEFAPVYVDTTPPAFGSFIVLPTSNPGAQRWDGTTLWFSPATSGAFSLRAFVGDAQSGVATVTIGPFASGFTPGPTSFATAPYQTTITWSPGAASMTAQVVATNNAGGSSTVPLPIVADAAAPVGASVSVPTTSDSGLVPVQVQPGTDAQSGLGGWQLQRRSAVITGDGCGEYSQFITIAEGTSAGTHDDGVGLGTCHEWRLVSTDAVGNSTTTDTVGSVVQKVVRGTTRNDDLKGTARADLIAGGRGSDRLYGFGGDDVLGGGVGNDRLFGGSGFDRLIGGPGDDYLHGGGGEDRLEAGGGNDVLIGSIGADTMLGGPGRDRFVGGGGNDLIGARDGARDRIACGPGRDTVIADWSDEVARDCEVVQRRMAKKRRKFARR